VHDALKRRCLYHWIEHPDFERELAILRVKVPHVPELLARQVAGAVESLRGLELYKPPGVAETLDWAQALVALEPRRARRRDRRRDARRRPQVPRDQERVRSTGVGRVVEAARARG
jgi:MoxR-like ATPase